MNKNKKEFPEKKDTNHIMEIIDNLEDAINKASFLPLTNKIVIEKDDILDYIAEMRSSYPAELRESNWVKSERERILSEAQKRADEIQQNAKEETMRLIDAHQITQQAYQRAEEINAKLQDDYRNIQQSASDFAEDVFSNLETRLSKLLEVVRREREDYNRDIEEKK